MQTGSLVCIGLDSDISLLPKHLLHEANPVFAFNRLIVENTIDYAVAFKPNLAFYLKDGMRGIDALYQTLEFIPEEIPVIIDAKVGDIGNTMDAYVSAFVDSYCADAITINPLMGRDVLSSLLSNPDAFGFVLCLTSNPSASDFLMQDKLDEKIASLITSYSSRRLGAVVGATQTTDLQRLRSLMPEQLFLIPGIGAQGGDLEAVIRYASSTKTNPNILINSSRGIIFKDKSIDFAKVAKAEAQKLHSEIRQLLET